MVTNVMSLVKTKGEKKLRGKKAQTAKRRAAAAPEKPKRMINKRNPFRVFVEIGIEEFSEEIDAFIERAGWTKMRKAPDPSLDREYVKLFRILKEGIPFHLAQQFFIDFDESRLVNIVKFFDEFKSQPDVAEKIENMKEFIKRREATPLKFIPSKPEEVTRLRTKSYQEISRSRKISPTSRPAPMFGSEEILSQCEREYRRAPWMFPFTDHVIRGFALKEEDSQFTTPSTVGGWFTVNSKWYEMACNGQRRFIPDTVAYVTLDGNLIVENEEMFTASRRDWIREFVPVGINSFEVAKRMLMNNEILKDTLGPNLERYAEGIIASFGLLATNYDLARNLSYILVFLTPLIEGPQIYHEKIRNLEFQPHILISLDRYMLLPEVFSNPNVDKAIVENKIKQLRRRFETTFYALVDQMDPTTRKKVRPSRIDIPVKTTQSISSAPTPIPVLGPVPEVPGGPEVPEGPVTMELAPGLFQKLRERITQLSHTRCNQCDAEVINPPYTTVSGTDVLKFCSSDCFDRFNIE
jgi:hypothetical protein